jgi:serine phosphatase RsbU (regulator of sigma subunit)
MVLDLMSRMAALDSEDKAIERIFELFIDLCAPEKLAYVSLVDGAVARAYCRPLVPDPEGVVERLRDFTTPWVESDSGAGFILSVQHAGERLGVLEIEGIALPEQRSHYLNLALTTVDVMGLAISNARLHERLVRARADAQGERDLARGLLGLSDALNTINATINSTLDFGDIMRHVVVEAAEATGADRVGMLRRGEDGWKLVYGHGYPADAVGKVYSSAQLPYAVRAAVQREVVVDNEAARVFVAHPDAALADDTGSIMTVALTLKGEVFGVLAFRARSSGVFNARRVDFARKLSSSLSLALHNARLFESQRTIADTLQQALLVMPRRIRGIEFGSLYQASTLGEAVVGGDFYDLFEIDNRSVGVVIGDIAGKGLKAATLTSLVKDSIRAYTHIDSSPAWTIEQTNSLLFDSTSDSDFATVFLGILDTESGELTYCSAGHPTALIRATDGAVRGLAVGSTVIGAFEEVEARDGTERLAPGEILVLYTDGITEARCKDDFFGEERLVETVSHTAATTAEMPEALVEAIKNCPDAMLPDDVAILCVSMASHGDGAVPAPSEPSLF